MVPALNLNKMLLCFWRHGFATKRTKRCSNRKNHLFSCTFALLKLRSMKEILISVDFRLQVLLATQLCHKPHLEPEPGQHK